MHPAPNRIVPSSDRRNSQADPVTPLAGAQHAATLLGDDSFLVEQLGFGHTSLAQVSSCTVGVVANYFENSTVGVGSDGMLVAHTY